MTDSAFLIVTVRGIDRMVKSRPAKGKPHTRPTLKAGEFAVLLQVNVPDMAFVPRPISTATLDVSVQKLVAAPVEVTQLEPPRDPFASDPDYQAGKKDGAE